MNVNSNYSSQSIISIVSSPSDSESEATKRFREKIETLNGHGFSLPVDMNLYTPLQRAIVLDDLEECTRLHKEGKSFNECGNADIHPFILSIQLANSNVSCFILENSSDVDQISYIDYLKKIGVLDWLEKIAWKFTSDVVKKVFLKDILDTISEDSDLLVQLFAKSSDSVQKEILASALMLDSITFYMLWQRALSTTKAYFENQGHAHAHLLLAVINKKYFLACALFPDAPKHVQIKAIQISELKLFRDYLLEMTSPDLLPSLTKNDQIASLKLCSSKVFPQWWEKASLELREYSNKGLTWLHTFICNEDKNKVEFLLKQGVDTRTVTESHLTPYLSAQINSSLFGEALLTELKDKDSGFSHDIERCALFGHRFDLQGAFFEGINTQRRKIVVTEISETASKVAYNYEMHRILEHLPELKEFFELSFSEDAETLYTRSLTKPTLFNTGWIDHQVAAVFTSKVCAKINTGTGNSRGIAFYRIQSIDTQEIKKAMSTLIENNTKVVPRDVGETYFEETFEKQLGLELFAYIKFQQKAGNCVWKANVAAVLSFMIFKEIEKSQMTINKESIQVAYQAVGKDFSSFTTRDCCDSISEILPILKKYPKYYDYSKILSDIILDSVENGRTSIVFNILIYEPSIKNWQHPTTKKSLIRYALEYQSFVLFQDLLEAKADLSLEDSQNKTIYDDVQSPTIYSFVIDSILEAVDKLPTINEQVQKLINLIKKTRDHNSEVDKLDTETH